MNCILVIHNNGGIINAKRADVNLKIESALKTIFLKGGLDIYKLEFENRMHALVYGIDSEAMKKILTYAGELDRDCICSQSEFLKKAYVEYGLVKQHNGNEIAYRIFNLSKTFILNPHEIRGAANLLRVGRGPEEIQQMAIDGLCGRTEQENQEHEAALENIQEALMYKDKPWFSDLCQLLEKGYCIPQRDCIYSISEACSNLRFTAGYRSFFGQDYVICCKEYDRYSLKRDNCLQYFLEKTRAELKEYSQEWDWKAPKPGFLKEWAEAAFRYERVKQMLDELQHKNAGFEGNIKIYVGTIGGWSIGKTKTNEPHNYVECVNFDVDYTGNPYTGLNDSIVLYVDHEVGIHWLLSGYYDEERHKRYDEDKSTVLRAYVDSINYIKKFEWIEA